MKKKEKVELRYYDIPQKEGVLALLGENWVRSYGDGIDYLHFHNLLEIGVCRSGTGELVLDSRIVPYGPDMISVIPKNYPHTTNSTPGTESAWEYLFLEPGMLMKEYYGENEAAFRRFLELTGREALFAGTREYPQLAGIVDAIMDEMRVKKSFYVEKVRGLLTALLFEIARITEREAAPHVPDSRVFGQISKALRYVDRPSRLGVPDLIFLPGSKNTMGDLRWLRESGMEAALLKAHAAGSAVFGVCGGYQMLGQTLSDPLGVESGGQMRGLGLLPLSTVFAGAKTRSRVHGYFGETGGLFRGLAGKEFEGYEIHMGRTERTGGDSFLQFSESHGNGPGESRSGGCVCGDVCGSYIHGLFDLAGVREAIVSALCERRGIRPSDVRTVDYRTYKEAQYVKLAEGLRESLDMKRIYEILWKGIA